MAHPRAVTAVRINGPALRAIRERSGVSCSALARLIGVDVSFLARIERGEKRGIARESWERICFALAIDPRAIMADPYGERVSEVTEIPAVPEWPHNDPTLVPSSRSTRSTPAA